MAQYALTHKASLAEEPAPNEPILHEECGESLTASEQGTYFCPHCLKAGHLVSP